MRLLIIGTLGGQLTIASKIAMDKGASVTHADSIDQGLAVLRSGRGADLMMVDVAIDIRELAEDLYSRLSTFVGHMNKLGRQLGSSAENYNRAVGSLERNVLPGARKFVELGVQAKKKMEKLETLDPVPRTMIEGAADDDESSDKGGETQENTLQ